MHGLFYNNNCWNPVFRHWILGRIGLNLGLDSLAIRGIGTSYGAQFTGIRVD